MEHGLAVRRTLHLRVELHGIQPLFAVLHRRNGTILRPPGHGKALRQRGDTVGVAHETELLRRKPRKQGTLRRKLHFRLAVFAGIAGRHLSAERPRHELCAVAYAEHRHTQPEQRRVTVGRALVIHTVGTAGQDNADRRKGAYFVHVRLAGKHDRIHAALAHTPCDKLLILTAEIENNNRL